MSDFGKKLGDFTPSDRVISKESFTSAMVPVASSNELDMVEGNCVLVTNDFSLSAGGGTDSFKKGDILIYNEEGSSLTGWEKVGSNVRSFGKATSLRGYQIGNYVYIRWKDPENIVDYDGNVVISRSKSILVRKYGSAPTRIEDGTTVCISYKEDQFSTEPFEDFVPIVDDEYNFFYKVFAVAENGYISASDELKMTRLSWDRVVSEIKEGNATDMFIPGDTIELSDGNELVVASIDTAQTTAELRSEHPHLVTFMFKYGFGPTPFDASMTVAANLRYKRTKDNFFINKKNYYKFDSESNSFVSVRVTVGDPISESEAYYEYVSEANARYGSNTWMNSDIRAWSNADSVSRATSLISEWMLKTGATITPTTYINSREPSDGKQKLTDFIVPTLCITRNSPINGNGTYSTADKFFIPSITEFMGVQNNGVSEGNQFQIFSDGIVSYSDYVGMSVNGSPNIVISSMWTRSASQLNEDIGIYVQSINGSTISNSLANSSLGVLIAFSIG